MTHITLPRATVEQALEAMRCAVPTGKITLADWHKSIAELEAVLAQQVKHVAWMRPWPPVRAQIEMDAGADFEIGPDLAQQAEPVAWEGWWLHHGQHNYRAKPLTSERVKELMKLAFEVGREATLPQQAEPVDQTTLDVSGTTSFSAIPPKLPEPYAGKAARLNNDRIQIDPVTGNVSIGAAQPNPPGCEHCNHPLYAATKCRVCGRVTEQAEPVEEPMAWAYMGIKQDGTEHGPHLVWKPEYMDAMSASKGAKATPLYTAPPQQAEPVPMPPFPPVSQWNRGCAVCGIGADGKAYGYVCSRSDCPTKVTCGGVA